MEPESSFPCLQEPATGPYPEPLKIYFHKTHPFTLCASKEFLPIPFTEILYAVFIPIRATCPTHLTLLDLINLIPFVEEYK
jgi:hypothetical protein